MDEYLKTLHWVGSSRRDLKEMPENVQSLFGFALHQAQVGRKHSQAKPLRGFNGSGVLEIFEDHMGGTFRAVYTVTIRDSVYVLHCFQKKSVRGIQTPKHEIDMIQARLKAAEAHARGRQR